MAGHKEHELIALLEDHGWTCLRAPGSGTRDAASPDVLAGKKVPVRQNKYDTDPLSRVIAIEAKYRSAQSSYWPREQVEDLDLFADGFGATPYVALRFNANKPFARGDTNWYFVPLSFVPLTSTKARTSYTLAKNYGFGVKEL